MNLLEKSEKIARSCLLRLESLFNWVFTEQWNPFYQLGALSFFFFWIAVISGVYLYIFFDTSIFGAYQSVEKLTIEQWYLGGVMRSLHRYSSDAMVVIVTIHMLREFSLGRFRHARWFSWFSGVPLLWLLFASAIGGYWLVWDQHAQYIAVTTSEWLDWLPNFSDPFARNFLNNEALNDRFFSLLVFLHIALPLFLLLGMFIHIKRVSNARNNPVNGLAWGSFGALLVLSLIKPALSMGPSNLSETVVNVKLDWFYLNIYPLINSWGPAWVWLLVSMITLILLLLPWFPSSTKKPQVAVVDPQNCNGCGWCFKDCPYEAIIMRPHDFKVGHNQSQVNSDLCTACGICAGACPSATPFRSVDELITGIDMPALTINEMLKNATDKISNLKGNVKVLIVGCDHAVPLQYLESENITTFSLPCVAQMPPSFIDYFLRNEKIDGIFTTGCGEDCFYRRGAEWVTQRFSGIRMPHLRTKAAKSRFRLFWAGPLQSRKLQKKINEYIESLSNNKTEKKRI